MDSLAMFFGGKKVKRSPARKVKRSPVRKVKSSHGKVVVKGRERKLYKGKNGGLYYKTKSGKAYVDAAFVRKHKASPKRSRRSASPKRHRRKASPKRKVHRSPMRKTRWGYGLGQPSLIDMMGPAGLTVVPRQHLLGPGGTHQM